MNSIHEIIISIIGSNVKRKLENNKPKKKSVK